MVELEDMDTTVKELQSYAKCRKSEIRRLDKDYYGSFGESDELIFYLFDLGIYRLGTLKSRIEMMIESYFLIFFDIM